MPKNIMVDCRWIVANNGFSSVIKMILCAINSQCEKFYILINENAKNFNFQQYVVDSSKLQIIVAKSAPFSFFQNIEIPYLIKKYNISIFHTLNYDIPLLRFNKFVLISTIHDLIPIRYKSLHKRNFFKTIYFEIMYRLCAILSDKIITVSNFSKEEIVKYLPVKKNNVNVIYNSYNSKGHEQNQNNNNIPVLLFVGSNFEHKNIHVVIDAVKLLSKKNIIVNFKIAGGKYKYSEYLESLIKKYNLENQVEILGKVDEKTLSELYTKSDIYVYPSLVEGFGIPLIEAMDYGLPIIASNKTVIPEIIGNAGLLIEPTPANFAEQIEILLKNSELKAKLIQNGYTRLLQFSQEKFNHSYLKFINNIKMSNNEERLSI